MDPDLSAAPFIGLQNCQGNKEVEAKKGIKKVLVLANLRSGLRWSFDVVRRAMDRWWEGPETDVRYQFAQNVADGAAKARRAVEEGVDCILVAGGDGTVSTVGRELIGTSVTLGMIPLGSGNGFARHFGIPLSPARAVHALAGAKAHKIDVGVVGETPFLVTCSMAWDASIAKAFARFPVRGILPYALAGAQALFEYKPQAMVVRLDGGKEIRLPTPLVFTVANLSQYGGGARIAPRAKADDGYLELVVVRMQDIPKLIIQIGRLFDGSIDQLPEVSTWRFRELHVRRENPTAIQVDGELLGAPTEIVVRVLPRALSVLVPAETV